MRHVSIILKKRPTVWSVFDVSQRPPFTWFLGLSSLSLRFFVSERPSRTSDLTLGKIRHVTMTKTDYDRKSKGKTHTYNIHIYNIINIHYHLSQRFQLGMSSIRNTNHPAFLGDAATELGSPIGIGTIQKQVPNLGSQEKSGMLVSLAHSTVVWYDNKKDEKNGGNPWESMRIHENLCWASPDLACTPTSTWRLIPIELRQKRELIRKQRITTVVDLKLV